MTQNKNIFKNSGIRDKAPEKITYWYRLKNIFSKNKKTFFTQQNIQNLGFTIGLYLQKKYNSSCNILFARDTRTSGLWIFKELQNNILMHNHAIFDANIISTPILSKTITHYKSNNEPFFQLGIMITASHNTGEYNGLKFFTPHGYLTEQEELEISDIFHNFQKNIMFYTFELSISKLLKLQSIHKTTQIFDAFDFYVNSIKKDINNTQFNGLKIIVDSANGATYDIAPKIFEHYGIQTIMINNVPNGTNINANSGCTNPKLLSNAIKQHDADWGCAFDGDGDRVLLIDNKGTIFDGDDIISVLAQHPRFHNENMIIGTIMSNEGIVQYFTQQNKKFIRTDVGERNIIQALQKHNAQLGSENCGHITILDHAPCSDGIYAALMFFDAIYSQQKITFHPCKKFIQKNDIISLENKIITDEIIEQIKNIYATTFKPGRIIIRKSNTEPVLRIMTEHYDTERAEQVLAKIKNKFVNI